MMRWSELRRQIRGEVEEEVVVVEEALNVSRRPSQSVLPYLPNYPYLAEYDGPNGLPH